MIHRFFLRACFSLLVFCGLLSTNVDAQSYFYSGIPELSNYRSSSVFPHPSGFVLSIAFDSAGFSKNSIILFNDEGEVIWHKRIAGVDLLKPKSIYFFENESFVLSGEEVISDSITNVFVCKFNALGDLTWGKKIIIPREINLAGPILEDSSRIFATVNSKRLQFESVYFEDALIAVFSAAGNQSYVKGLVSNSFAREFKLTHATIAQNGDFLGLISYRVNATNPGAGFVLVRMSNEGDLRFSYSINLNQSYRFGSTRGICETVDGKIIVACQLDSADTNSTIKPGYLAMFADSGTVLKQRIIGYTDAHAIQIEQLSNTSIGIPNLYCTVEENGQQFWAIAKVDTADLSLFGTRRIPVSTDVMPIDERNSIRNAAIPSNYGGVITTGGIFCGSELNSFPALTHWSSEATIECQTLNASQYFEDSVVNYQINTYALSALTGVVSQNFLATLNDFSLPSAYTLCNGCLNLSTEQATQKQAYFEAFAELNSREIQLINKSNLPVKWNLYGINGQCLGNGLLETGNVRIPVQNSGIYFVNFEGIVIKTIVY